MGTLALRIDLVYLEVGKGVLAPALRWVAGSHVKTKERGQATLPYLEELELAPSR
jgi:hypothetical protein